MSVGVSIGYGRPRTAHATTTQSITHAKTQVQKTLDAYNHLVTKPSANVKGDYKKLMKTMDSMNDKVAGSRQKIEAMQPRSPARRLALPPAIEFAYSPLRCPDPLTRDIAS